MTSLIHRLETAAEGSRDLDGDIALLLGWKKDQEVPFFTESIDDALTLVPEGWSWRLDNANPTHPEADLWGPIKRLECKQEYISAGGRTPALALCVGVLSRFHRQNLPSLNHGVVK